ncbi:TonB family protein [Dyadobacter flavalbus]|uniref:TonB family protein n=1 Tax=Dyadobacter flavalbus TaxID=2579942 RepID=A0A5M8QS08_9BACT|nr:M56 family metallopeptidase [Dyadobacter flavalbus]KAA6438995.1 TonB family protein [Dyadobacter flavalbus]
MEMLLYIGKVNLYWVLLLACYRLMLRNHTFFQYNRIYLLGSVVAAFALPFVIYPADAPPIPVIYEVSTTMADISFVQQEQQLFTWMDAVWVTYLTGLAVAGYILLRNIFQLRRFIRSGEMIELDDCSVVMINSSHIGSFSFLKWIVINRNDYESHFDDILSHEMIHTRQWHSADILFVEIMKVLFWFSPILLLYKRDLQEVHEFLADSKASNRENYARFLVSYTLNVPAASLTNHFFKPSQIKSRIQMIYKNRSSKWLLGTYLAVATLIGATAVLVAGCEQKDDKQPETADAGEEKMPEKVFTEVDETPEFPGGETAMFQFLGKNVKYPTAAAKAGVQGKVFVSFIVSETGAIQNVAVEKGIGFGCDEEAARVIKSFPTWTPGKQNGNKVNVKLTLPIHFMLEENASEKLSTAGIKNNPLYLVDGQEMKKEDVAKHVPPHRIASVRVIKDEKAVAAYSSKGKNGVIEISTKPAKPDAARQATIVHISDPSNTESKAAVKTDKPGPGSPTDMKVQVKEKESLFSEPLYIIDGVKQKRGFITKTLDPEKIQSINVLKNQSATAPYGNEGRNGVILITTKKN